MTNRESFECIAQHLYKRQYQTASGEWSTLYYGRFKDWKRKRRTFSLGSDLKTAREELKVLEARNIRKEDFDADKKKKENGYTFSEWVKQYFIVTKKKKSKWKRQICENHLKPFFGDMALSDIRRSTIMTYKDRRQDSPIIRHGQEVEGQRVCVSSVNRELAVLRQILNEAAEREIIETAPKVSQESEKDRARDRILFDEEYRRLLDHSPRWLQRVFVGAYEACLSRSDLLNLTWSEVNRRVGVIKLEGGRDKTKVRQIVPISPELNEVLDELWQEHQRVPNMEGRVFTRGGRSISPSGLRKAFEKAVRSVGIQNFRFHDFRHTAKTRWVANGVPTEAAMLAAGHKSVEAHYRYVNMQERHLIQAFLPVHTPCTHETQHEAGNSLTS